MGSRSQTTDTTMPNYWWPPSPTHSDEEDEEDVEDEEDTEDEEDVEDEEDTEDEEDVDDEKDEGSDDQHRQHNAFWKGFRAAIKGYASSSSSEGEEEVHFDQDNVKEDEDHDEHEQEDDGRPYSRSRTPRCSSRCKYYPCDRPIRSPRSSSPVVGPYRPSEAHLLESDYDSDVEENYVDIPVPPSS